MATKIKIQAEVPGESPQPLVLDKLCLTVEDAMQVLSLGRNSIYELIDSEQLFSFKFGRRRLVPLRAIHDYIDRQMQAS